MHVTIQEGLHSPPRPVRRPISFPCPWVHQAATTLDFTTPLPHPPKRRAYFRNMCLLSCIWPAVNVYTFSASSYLTPRSDRIKDSFYTSSPVRKNNASRQETTLITLFLLRAISALHGAIWTCRFNVFWQLPGTVLVCVSARNSAGSVARALRRFTLRATSTQT